MLNVDMLNGVMLCVASKFNIMLNVVMLSVASKFNIMLNVVILSVILQIVTSLMLC
jgi:hypothetical protein